jgi:hypothetical protein
MKVSQLSYLLLPFHMHFNKKEGRYHSTAWHIIDLSPEVFTLNKMTQLGWKFLASVSISFGAVYNVAYSSAISRFC